MHKPKEITVRSMRAAIHLNSTTPLALDKLVTKSISEPASAIGASAIHDNNLRSRCSLPQMSKEWPYQRRLVKDRSNDGDLHLSSFLTKRPSNRVRRYLSGRWVPSNFRLPATPAKIFMTGTKRLRSASDTK
jgi:hypothetical protein